MYKYVTLKPTIWLSIEGQSIDDMHSKCCLFEWKVINILQYDVMLIGKVIIQNSEF